MTKSLCESKQVTVCVNLVRVPLHVASTTRESYTSPVRSASQIGWETKDFYQLHVTEVGKCVTPFKCPPTN